MNCKIKMDGNITKVLFKPILGVKREYILCGEDGKPSQLWYTATNRMTDFIGNVTHIKDGMCDVRGVYLSTMQCIKNIKIVDKLISKIGHRVMVTEHIDIEGKLELIATKKRILYGDLNFINIGSPNKYIMIDVYTGKFKLIEVSNDVV